MTLSCLIKKIKMDSPISYLLVFLLELSSAIAETSSPPAAPSTPMGAREGLTPFIPLILIFGIFYFLIIRPQQKKAKDHQKFLTELKKGDVVVTNSGIIGTIKTIGEKFVTLEIDENVSCKMLRTQILENASNLKEEIKK